MDLGAGVFDVVVKPTAGSGPYHVDVGFPKDDAHPNEIGVHIGNAPFDVKIDLGSGILLLLNWPIPVINSFLAAVDPSKSTVDRVPLARLDSAPRRKTPTSKSLTGPAAARRHPHPDEEHHGDDNLHKRKPHGDDEHKHDDDQHKPKHHDDDDKHGHDDDEKHGHDADTHKPGHAEPSGHGGPSHGEPGHGDDDKHKPGHGEHGHDDGAKHGKPSRKQKPRKAKRVKNEDDSDSSSSSSSSDSSDSDGGDVKKDSMYISFLTVGIC